MLMSVSRKKAKGEARHPTGWDVLIRLIDAIYDLAQTGNLIGLVVLGAVGWVLLATYKVPDSEMSGLLLQVAQFLGREKFYLFPLLALLAVSIATNAIQASVYRRHIKDLTEHRQRLVHGRETGELQPLEHHRSSNFDIEDEVRHNQRR